MLIKSRFAVLGTLTLVVLVGSALIGAQSSPSLKIEDVMTAQEMTDAGISGLTTAQRRALNVWLNRYTTTAYNISTSQQSQQT